MFWKVFCLLCATEFIVSSCQKFTAFPCDSDIYCHGRLLDTIQMAKIYKDSKKFVDMKMRFAPNETLSRFDAFMVKFNNKPTKRQVRDFVESTFEPEGHEFENWEPTDWKTHPKFVDKIEDTAFKKWAYDLNLIWKFLGRKLKPDIIENKNLYSIIWIPNPVIVPGGRFREFYYWDTYWIIRGLLLSEMYETVRGILENFLYIVDEYGHIPNGGRIYYLARSQPPLLIPMMKSYMDITGDKDFIIRSLPTMEREFQFWMKNHTTVIHLDGKNYTLGIYGDKSLGPRPESYSEDVDTASIFPTQEKKEAYYSELKAAAESGWDFSSRWFVTNATNKGNLTSIKTRSIAPVDLNAMIYWNAVLLAEFNDMIGNQKKVEYYTDLANKWLEAVEAVFWHEEAGVWLDYDYHNEIKRDYFSPSNIAPLWTGCYNRSQTDHIVKNVLNYLRTKNVLYPGGVPTTVEHTGEQWDYPNAWPPLQHIMIVGLNNTGDEAARNLAFEIAKKWVRSNYKAYNDTESMYEKYDATIPGGHGGGGEYEVQEGFGWTNGIIMDLLNMYSKTLRLEDPPEESVAESSLESGKTSSSASTSYSQLSTALIALLVSLTAGFIGVCIYKKRNSSRNDEAKRPFRSSKPRYTELDGNNINRRTKNAR